MELLKTIRLSWDEVSRILEAAVFGILHKEVRLTAWSEDADYWGVLALDHRFSPEDLSQRLEAVQADDEVRSCTLPDDDTSTNCFGMDLGNLLLKREQAADWADTHITESWKEICQGRFLQKNTAVIYGFFQFVFQFQ